MPIRHALTLINVWIKFTYKPTTGYSHLQIHIHICKSNKKISIFLHTN